MQGEMQKAQETSTRIFNTYFLLPNEEQVTPPLIDVFIKKFGIQE
jgi:hypothetical protein